MDRETKIGVIFIIVGICIPLLTLPFLSSYSKDKGFFENIYKMGIPIKKEKPEDIRGQAVGIDNGKPKTLDYSILIPKRIPLRFFLVITLIFWYIGIIRIDKARRKRAGQDLAHDKTEAQTE
ncbi:MAG: hypothetical protein C0392_01280 [Syntrophus sp. (in: bacteria)]|nr:hypothetical protein [Syntrophus sp. (in: bacteria)]